MPKSPNKNSQELELDLDNKEWQDALQIVDFTRRSLFLTGKAGTGKSTFLRYVVAHTKKKNVVLAPTGIAAINDVEHDSGIVVARRNCISQTALT